MKLKRLLATIIAYAMILSLGAAALAADPDNYTDLPDRSSYSYSSLVAAIRNDIMVGDGTGKIMPNNIISRAEGATYLVRVMGATTRADVTKVTDYVKGSWYDAEGSLAIAIQMGLLDVVNNRVNPNDPLTREEAFEMMARAIAATGGKVEDLSKFSDADTVSNKYVNSVASLVNGGYVQGTGQGSTVIINPKAAITRAEFATLFGRVFEQYITEAGVYTSVSDGNVIVKTEGVTLKDVVVTGDLIIGDGVGNGNVALDNVTVEGRLIVRGGAVSINGVLKNVVVVNSSAKLYLGADADIDTLTIAGDSITVNTALGSLVDELMINGKSASITGYVLISNAQINAAGAVIESSPASTVIASGLSAKIGGAATTGTTTTSSNAPTVTLRLGRSSGAYGNLTALYAAAKAVSARNRVVIEISTALDDVLVIDSDNFPGRNNITVKFDSGYTVPLTYGIAIERANVTLDGLSFDVTDTSNIVQSDNEYRVISVDGYKKGTDGKNIAITATTIRNCDITFNNDIAGMNVAAVYFDETTASGNTITGGTIDVTGQTQPYDSIGVFASEITLTNATIKSNDRALVIRRKEAFTTSNISITGTTKLYSVSGAAVELQLNKVDMAAMENAFGTVFGGYSNIKTGVVRNFVDSVLSNYIKTDSWYTARGVKLSDYKLPALSELYHKDASGYIWSRCNVSDVWVYCNTPVTGNFTVGRMYMLVDADSDVLTTGDTRFVKANGTLSSSFTDMGTLNTSKSALANHPTLNDDVTYRVVAMSPYSGEIKGLVASLTSIPYAVETHFAANGTEIGADNPSKAGNLNANRSGKVNLTVTGGSDIEIYLYLNLSGAVLGGGMEAWNYIDGAENIAVLDVDSNTATNPLAANRQRFTLDVADAVNTLIIKGNDGNYLFVTVTVTVR